jgi:hypothetical protein
MKCAIWPNTSASSRADRQDDSSEGMNLKVDLVGKRLVSAGPIMAAVAA